MYGHVNHRKRYRGEVHLVRAGGYEAGGKRGRRRGGVPKVVLGFMLFMTVLLSVSLYGVNQLSDAEEAEQVVGVLAKQIPPEMLGEPVSAEAGSIVMLAERQKGQNASASQDDAASQDDLGPQPLQNQTPLVAIDAYCGGADGDSRQVDMEVALRLEKQLQDLGFETLLVRNGEEEAAAMEERVKGAESGGADIYVSICRNTAEGAQSGIETWYCQGSEDGRRLARLVHKGAVGATGANDRDVVEKEGMYAIKEASMPACHIETGFYADAAEGADPAGEEYPEKLAKGIAQGIDLYFHPKTMYLTFDDGPSEENTAAVLDILKEKGIKATFFLVGENVRKHPEMARRIVEEGHTIGVHCNRHVYTEVYASVDSYLEDFEEAYNAVYEITGVEVELFRFPGGSINSYNKAVYEDIIKEMEERGFIYFDWNASLEDATKNTTPEQLIANAVSSTLGRKKVVMLAHDIQKNTVLCLEELLDSFPEYQMEPLTSEVTPIQF